MSTQQQQQQQHHGTAASSEEGTPSPSSGSDNSMMAMEQKMREQIRLLQEQRAAAMMEEVIDLQRERDLALGRIKSLKKNIEDLTMENALLKGAVRGDLAEKLITIERNYLEERLLNNDLKKKLQAVSKQKGELLLRVRRLEMVSATRQALSPLLYNSVDKQRERSQSLTNLSENDSVKLTVTTPDSQPSIVTTPTTTPTAKLPPSGRKTSPPSLAVSSGQATPKLQSGTNTPQSYSPTVIPRRYKLAAAVTRDVSAQTEPHISTCADQSVPAEETQDVSSDVIATLENARRDIIALQQEKERLEGDLNTVTSQRSKEKVAYKKECAALQTECNVLKESLSKFSSWARQKIQLFEEDMDIFKVVYSLHGSLSQEKELLKELREKLSKSELKIVRLENENAQLQDELSHTENKYKQCKKENKRLCERRLTPPNYHSPPMQRHIHPGQPALRSHSHKSNSEQSSPLLSRSSPKLTKTMFPVSLSIATNGV